MRWSRARACCSRQMYRAEVRQNYEEFKEAFAVETKWRDEWAKENRNVRRKAKAEAAAAGADGDCVAPSEGDETPHSGGGIFIFLNGNLDRGTRAGNSTTADTTPVEAAAPRKLRHRISGLLRGGYRLHCSRDVIKG